MYMLYDPSSILKKQKKEEKEKEMDKDEDKDEDDKNKLCTIEKSLITNTDNIADTKEQEAIK